MDKLFREVPMMDGLVTLEQSKYMPTECPVCKSKLVWKGVHIMCPNPQCNDAALQDVLIWLDYIAPTDGLGDLIRVSFLEEIYKDDISIESIYRNGLNGVVPLDQDKTATFNKCANMLNRAIANKDVDPVDAIMALNVPRLGPITATKLAAYPDIIKSLSEGIVPYDCEQKIGKANCESIRANISKFKRLKYLDIDYSAVPENLSESKQVAITGQLSMKRSEFERLLVANNFKPVSSVNKSTFALVTNDPNSGSSKNTAAHKLNIPILTEQQFISKYLA